MYNYDRLAARRATVKPGIAFITLLHAEHTVEATVVSLEGLHSPNSLALFIAAAVGVLDLLPFHGSTINV
jgi:hypothetical protein